MALITPPLILTPFANAGDQTVIPPTDPNGFVNFANGYTPDYEINLGSGDPQAKAVERGIQNYLFNALTTAVQAWQTSNRPPWYAGFPGGYAKYAEVVVANAQGVPVPYRSLVAGNVAQPGASANWEYVQGSGEMIENIPMPSGGPGGPGVMLITQATDFNTFTSAGTFQFQTDAVVAASPNYPVNGPTAGAAGMLEVTTWANGANNYFTQFYRDRNGIGFMRGGTNGAWTPWKIWVNSTQFVVGEVRMWTGTASESAVQAAWGAGWHFCNGANGTPNLGGLFVLGASSTIAPGSTGGANTVTLSTANLPAHNHGVTVTDNGHTHGITQTAHTHTVNDPGHAHAVYDPSHVHTAPSSPGVGQGAGGGNSVQQSSGSQYTNPAATGISIYGNGTGLTNWPANANVSVNAATTGITAVSTNTGNGNPVTVTPPYYALSYVMYTGV